MSYFSVLDLPEDFNLDTAALEQAYFRAQRSFHPDRMVGKGPVERAQAISQSMLVNEAYAALKFPLSRARHLLALQGIKVGSEQDSVKPSNALLMEAMEIREALSEAKTKADVEAIESSNNGSKLKTIEKIAAAFKAKDAVLSAELTLKLGYQEKLDDEIRMRKKGLAA